MSRGDSIYALRFELHNQGEAAIELPIREPFTAFSLLATADEAALTVHQPALDIAVNPATLRLPAGKTVTLRTPIRLRIAEGAEPGIDGFIWTIRCRREAVSLQAKPDLPAPFAGPCPVLFE